MKTVIIQYTLKEDAKVEDVEANIRAFVEGIRGLGVGIDYTSYRKADRAYLHRGVFPDDDALKKLQASDFFKKFSAYLPDQCSAKPQASWVEQVATSV